MSQRDTLALFVAHALQGLLSNASFVQASQEPVRELIDSEGPQPDAPLPNAIAQLALTFGSATYAAFQENGVWRPE